MPKTNPSVDQFCLVDPTEEIERTHDFLEERVLGVLNKCQISYEGKGNFDVYGEPAPNCQIYISPRKGTCIVGVSTELDLTECRVSEINDLNKALNSGYAVRLGRTTQGLDLPCFIFRNPDRKREIKTIPVKGIILPPNY